MKISILILLISYSCLGQNKYTGFYKNYFSEKIELKADSTFRHQWGVDLSWSWTIGKWKVKNDTIHLIPKFIMDTLQVRNSYNNIIREDLVLSVDESSERIEQLNYISTLLTSGGQYHIKPPRKLLWKKEKLYIVKENGKLDLRKRKPNWSDKKYKDYFIKQ